MSVRNMPNSTRYFCGEESDYRDEKDKRHGGFTVELGLTSSEPTWSSEALIVENEYTLLARARRLDEDALAEIHDTYYTAIYRYVAMKIGDRVLAEDLTSDVFMRLLSALRDQTAPQKTLRGWLYAVASRVVADHFRKRYRREEVALPETLESSAPSPFTATAETLEWERLHKAITELTADQQDVIALRFGYGMPIKEVADALDKSEGAIKQLQARAVASLARILEDA